MQKEVKKILKNESLKVASIVSAAFIAGWMGNHGFKKVGKKIIGEFNQIQMISVYDGDTIMVTLPGIHPLFGERIGIHIKGLDTPELETKDECEKERGYQAKKVAQDLLLWADRVDLKNCTRGKYFRVVCDVIADNLNLAELLLSKRLAYSYDGGTKKEIDWCMYGEFGELK